MRKAFERLFALFDLNIASNGLLFALLVVLRLHEIKAVSGVKISRTIFC
nr:MAG TPA: hypothetical protein [Caudoviricetes sp.]